ncbi:MAG: adenylate/guanylate cyclase domain-containing protein [Vulcanimicrobiota bacterium]
MPLSGRQPSLARLSLLSILATVALLVVLLGMVYQTSRQSWLGGGDLLLRLDGLNRQAQQEVSAFLTELESIVELFEGELKPRLGSPQVASDLRRLLGRNNGVSEVTLVWAAVDGYDQRGAPRFRRDGRRYVCALRDENGQITVSTDCLPSDPVEHATVRTAASLDFQGRSVWSDLHYSQTDGRVVVTLQKAIYDRGRLLAVVRVARPVERLGRVPALLGAQPGRHHWVFLGDPGGGLVTPLSAQDRLVEQDGNLRFAADQSPTEITEALAALRGARLGPGNPSWFGRVDTDQGRYLVAFRWLAGSQDWVVGQVLPESELLAPLAGAWRRLIVLTTLAALLLIGGGCWLLRLVHEDLSKLVAAADQLRDFEFGAEPTTLNLSEMARVGQSLEGSKVSLRALSKYSPLGLVRQLLAERLSPELGGEVREVSMMFTDVESFTTFAEQAGVDHLAGQLADYLQRMSGPIHRYGGSLLERVGDALLCVWNAPERHDNHARAACLAALDCVKATRDLPWHTRYGLHADRVMVGHFGSAERLNYGLLGDGVNLCSRIEGLNKLYGTTILVTAPIRQGAGDDLRFRHVDRVVVKGRLEGVDIYELVTDLEDDLIEAYEKAWQLYGQRDFEAALEAFEALGQDGPSLTLARRCRHYLVHPPDPGWTGTFVASFK